MLIKKRLSILLCMTLMFSLILGAISPIMAKSTREAAIDTVIGEVKVTKAGGSKSYQAFEGMTLNQGDHIQTGSNSKVVLRIVDHDDQITIDEKSSMYISELSENAKGKKSKMKMWAGSLWGKVKSLAGTDDEFTVETPTAVMGVQGTTLLLGVDPATGLSKFFIASGLGKVNKKGDESSNSGTTLLPSQEINLDSNTQASDYGDLTNIADITDLIANTSNAIIEAILASKAAMDQENEEYINKLRNEQGTGGNSAEIDRINQNLDNLVGNIINKAISEGKIEQSQVKALIDKINESLNKKLDLSKVKEPELSAGEKAKQAQLKLLEEERNKKLAADKLKQDELKKQNEALLKKLQDQLEKQKQEKQKAEQAAKKKAEEEYTKKLGDEAAKLAFEAKQKALEVEKSKQAAAKAAADAAKAAADAAKAPAPAPAPAPTPGSGSGGNDNNPPPAQTIKGKVIVEWSEEDSRLLNISLKDFGTAIISGIQLHFTYSSEVYYDGYTSEAEVQFEYGMFGNEEEAEAEAEVEITALINEHDIESGTKHELMVLMVQSGGPDQVANIEKLLVELPFINNSGVVQGIVLKKAIIVDKNGEPLEIEYLSTPLTIEPTPYID